MSVLKQINGLTTRQHKVWAVDHDAKYGNPPSITVMVYGLGISIFTLENVAGWRLKSVSSSSMYSAVEWDTDSIWPSSETGAYDLAAYCLKGISEIDNFLREQRA